MKSKLLLFILLLTGGILNAQDTIRSLMITEARLDRQEAAYVEITNMGTEPIQLADFEFGHLTAYRVPWDAALGDFFMLPERILQPGENFIIAAVFDFIEQQHFVDPDNYGKNLTKKEWWTLADMHIHMADANSQLNPSIKDSVSANSGSLTVWNGRDCWYIEQHLSETDSFIVDQVGGVFDQEGGTNYERAYDVAGVTDATYNSILIRKFIFNTGNIDFASARGIGIDDSEWMPVPLPYENYDLDRAVFWTVGNHGDYNLDENTLVTDDLEVDFANKTITVPWGTRNQDDLMTHFEKKPGIAWHYHLSEAYADSAYNSVRAGDKLTIYVCGSDLDVATFDLIVADATSDANILVSKYRTKADGTYTDDVNSGRYEAFRVTENMPGMDTIIGFSFYGITYATPVDTLIKYLEKAPKASLEVVWVDGEERTSVVNGDKLKVTADNGDVKEYFVKVNSYRPSENAYLSSIVWPDIPEFYKGIFGWIGDTIPGFGSSNYNYKVQVPLMVDGIPALVAKTQDLNGKIDVKRATTLDGTLDQKTVTFTVTAEDDITQNTYNVQLEKEKNPINIQPFYAEPFLSEFNFRDQFGNNFTEICNPGNQPLDLSNYLFYWGGADNPSGAITGNSGIDDWMNRYSKYIPGYKWVDEASWAVSPGIVEQDLNVNSIVMPGDVFVMADIIPGKTKLSGMPWWASEQSDVIFRDPYNPWGEATSKPAVWYNNKFHMFKILNDSIKKGLKPANDPSDFELMETFGMSDGSKWIIGGTPTNQIHTYIRKPNSYTAKPEYEQSFGTNADDSEWIMYNEAYWKALNTSWPARRLNITLDVGKHFMDEITTFKSTVTSIVYKVSPGYSMNESIKGVRTGTTVADFLGGIVKAHENQTLKVKAVADGSELAMDALLSLDDILEVISADSVNTTKYALNVNEEGLSANALLTSSRYTIEIQSDPKSASETAEAGAGTIAGFEYGTSLKTVVANIIVPAGASMDMVDGEGAYVPLKMLNFDTTYVNVTVNDNIYFVVTAEDGVTKIEYQLSPDVSEKDAFITSVVYSVVQKDVLIHYVPRGTNVNSFLANLVPSAGASIQLVDKLGHERMEGNIAVDDKVIVTSPDGSQSKVYFISLLAEEYIPETTYLAYILSNVYDVNQVAYEINGVSGIGDLSDFYSKITASLGANAVVVDKNGTEKTSGNIDGTDMLKVTSADGKIVVMYTFGQLVSSGTLEISNIELYPNPTNGVLNISGVEKGNRIQIYNATGAVIRDINVQSNLETVSLDREPAGMYMIIVSDKNELLGRFKAIKN